MRDTGKTSGASRSGSALIVALWTVILLTLMIGSFAFDMHIEARLTSHYRKRLKADYLATAGIERARMLLVMSSDPKIKDEDNENKDASWFQPAKNLALGSAVYAFTDTLETGTVSVDIVPEIARRNANQLTPEDWKKVLEVGGIPEDQWDALIDSVLDWIDSDGLTRVNGAEEDYYKQLTPPYKPRNSPLYTVDELLLVKGFTPDILDGRPAVSEEEPPILGIRDLLTDFGDRTVNVNVASKRVLMSLPGVDEATADEIIRERETPTGEENSKETKLFTDPNDFFGRFPALRSQLQSLITTASGTYRITSTGTSQGVKRCISCVADVNTRNGTLTVRRWVESEGEGEARRPEPVPVVAPAERKAE